MIDGASLTKITLYICTAAVIIFITKSCELRTEIIQECEESCTRMLGSQLLSVSNTKCLCTGATISEAKQKDSIWVIPRK